VCVISIPGLKPWAIVPEQLKPGHIKSLNPPTNIYPDISDFLNSADKIKNRISLVREDYMYERQLKIQSCCAISFAEIS